MTYYVYDQKVYLLENKCTPRRPGIHISFKKYRNMQEYIRNNKIDLQVTVALTEANCRGAEANC